VPVRVFIRGGYEEEIGGGYENFILFNVGNVRERARDNSSASVLWMVVDFHDFEVLVTPVLVSHNERSVDL
jgi:hypothetical protein